MKLTAHITLEIEIDEASQDADHVGRVVTGLAQSCAFRAAAEGVRVGDYSVEVLPVSRETFNALLTQIADIAERAAL